MKMTNYSDAIALLPDNYKERNYDDVKEIMFAGRLVIANGKDKPIVYENGSWKEFVYENTLSPA